MMLITFSCALVQIFKAVTLIAKNGRKPFSQSARYAAGNPLWCLTKSPH
jgi:hypothetical protein